MAHLSIPSERREISESAAIRAYLEAKGIRFEQWPLADRCDPDASQEAVLAAYAPEIERLKAEGGYVTADLIDVSPDTPGLDAMLERFSKEHTHSEDEVRFIVKGRGVFHIHPSDEPVFALQLDAGDWINVPAGMRHWFDLCAERRIRAIRLFLDKSGWTPHYVEAGLHAQHQPVCWGMSYLPLQEGRAPLATAVQA